jgi:hypothetical protein
MSHLKLLLSLAVTCVLAAAANAAVAVVSGYNIYALKIWLVAPVGAALTGFIAASGAALAARYFNAAPKRADALLMLIMAAATMALIAYFDATLALDDEVYKADKIIDFRSYFDLVAAKAQSGAAADEAAEGEYYLAAIEFLGFIGGGAMRLALAGRRIPRKCASCGGALRKVKTITTPVLSFQETAKVLDLFETGDSQLMQKLLAWRPEERRFGPQSERATVTYDLYACPNCRNEEIVVSVRAFKGKTWKDVPSLSATRNFGADPSLRDSFR